MALPNNVSWTSGDPFDISKLADMVTNDNDLDDRMPSISYRFENDPVITADNQKNIVIAAGVEDFESPTETHVQKQVLFPAGIFSPSCNPVIVATVEKKITKPISLVIHNLNHLNTPGPTGFECHIVHDNFQSPINSHIKLHWIAVGWNAQG